METNTQTVTGEGKVPHVLEQARKLALDDGYTLKDDVIRDPGKFQGEHIMTLYYYDAYMNGDGDQYGDDNDLKFDVSKDEAEAFNITEGAQVILEFSEQGFVSSFIKD